jgi:imidazolonepropionase
MRLRPLEAIAAATINGAAAMGLSDVAGSIAVGRAANIIMSRPMSDLVEIGYHFGSDPVENVLINGRWMRH